MNATAGVDLRPMEVFVREATKEHDSILELGAGAGELTEALRADGKRVVATDPNPAGSLVLAGDLLALPSEVRGEFDAVVARGVLRRVPSLKRAVKALAQLVRPGGLLVVEEFDHGAVNDACAEWLFEWLKRADAAWQPPSPEDCHAELREELAESHRWPDMAMALLESFKSRRVAAAPMLTAAWCGSDPGALADEHEAIAARRLPAIGRRLVTERRCG